MADVQFADILFVLLVCGVIAVILTLVNRSNTKNRGTEVAAKQKSNEQSSEPPAEED
jgi:hypothetical protein